MLTCWASNVRPYAYLLFVLTEVPQCSRDADVSDLLPFNFAKRQVAAISRDVATAHELTRRAVAKPYCCYRQSLPDRRDIALRKCY